MTNVTQTLFIRDGQSVVNAGKATTATYNGDFTLLLDDKCQKLSFKQGEGALELFERVKKAVKQNDNYALILENGGFIDARVISTAFVSSKTGNVVVVGINDRPLCVFDGDAFSDLEGLAEAILDALVSVSKGVKMSKIDWAAYKH